MVPYVCCQVNNDVTCIALFFQYHVTLLFCVNQSRDGTVAKFLRIVQTVFKLMGHSAKRSVTSRILKKLAIKNGLFNLSSSFPTLLPNLVFLVKKPERRYHPNIGRGPLKYYIDYSKTRRLSP